MQLGGTRLQHELERIPLWRGDNVGLKQLAEDMARYLYLPRLRDEDVLAEAVRDGVGRLTWQQETFAYAEGWDEQRKRYRGLRAGESVRVLLDGQSLLVKPDVAAAQMAADAARAREAAGDGGGTVGEVDRTAGGTSAPQPGVVVAKKRKLGRFYGSVRLDPVRLGRDAARIAEEVVQHLAGLAGAGVEITLEIQANLPDGATEKLVRDVTENCRTLKFTSCEFEETQE